MKISLKIIKIISVLNMILLVIFLASCDGGNGNGGDGNGGDGGDGNGGNGEASLLSIMDIKNASNLFIAKTASSQAMTLNNNSLSNETQKLFKITDEGYIEEVNYYDGEGTEITIQNQPVLVFNVNSEYVIVVFGYDEINPENGYLVRKSDGAVFSLNTEDSGFGHTLPLKPPSSFLKNRRGVYTDSFGNVYYIGYSIDFSSGNCIYDVFKLNIQSPELITKEVYNPDTESVHDFTVDDKGNMAYWGYLKSDFTINVNRIKKANGGLYNFTSNFFWTGIDNKIYYYKELNIIQITIDDSYKVTETTYGTLPAVMSLYSGYRVDFYGRTLLIDSGGVYEVYNQTNNPRKIDLLTFNMSSVTQVVSSDNYYYISGKDLSIQPVLIKVDPNTDEYVDLYTPGDYDTYKMTVSSTDNVTFNALRMADGVKVIGRIDASGNLEIIDETLNTELIVLERIN